ncbi:hypothetical protein B0H13DRAFT_2529833 [Mycena leptocephala]|nr:hypothetical protein B0H13DRAFT_2529833 [Mycena leptocephala]
MPAALLRGLFASTSLAGAFKDYPLPTVTTLCIPGGTTLFPAFPNIQSLTFSTYAHRDTLLLAKRSFPQLHSLGGVYLTPDSVVELVHGFLQLRSLYLSGPIHEDSAPLLSRLSALPLLPSLSLENRMTSTDGQGAAPQGIDRCGYKRSPRCKKRGAEGAYGVDI